MYLFEISLAFFARHIRWTRGLRVKTRYKTASANKKQNQDQDQDQDQSLCDMKPSDAIAAQIGSFHSMMQNLQ